MTGRPSTYSEEIAERICARLAEGRSLRSICKDSDAPGLSTVTAWVRTRPEFQARYALAREAQADALADEILDIVDDATNDWVTRERKDGSTETVLDAEHVQRSRLRVDARKWLAAKMAPKKYGDVQKLEHSGPDGAPIEINSTVGLAVAAVRELRGLRMDSGALPAPSEDDAADVL